MWTLRSLITWIGDSWRVSQILSNVDSNHAGDWYSAARVCWFCTWRQMPIMEPRSLKRLYNIDTAVTRQFCGCPCCWEPGLLYASLTVVCVILRRTTSAVSLIKSL
jgi:hypothetical protein